MKEYELKYWKLKISSKSEQMKQSKENRVRKKSHRYVWRTLCFSSAGRPIARIDETIKEPQSITISNPRFARNVPTVNPPSVAVEVYSQNFMDRQPKHHISELQFEKIPTIASFQCWRTSFKTEVCSGSNYPSEAMRWIEEVEMATSADDLKTSQSIFGHQFPNFEMLDVKIASSLKKIIQNSNFQKRVFVLEPKKR